MKTFFSIIAILFTAIVTALFVAGYISKNNAEVRASYESTIKGELDAMVLTMNEATNEIDRLQAENEDLKVQIESKATTQTKTATTQPAAQVQSPPKSVPTTIPKQPAKQTTVTTPVVQTAVQTAPTLTASLVSQHSSESDCWIIVSGKVYSVASYITMHPGGRSTIVNQCGKDATQAFSTRGGTGKHSSSAQATLNTFLIGSIGSPLKM